MAKKTKKLANRTPAVIEEHQEIINQYFTNGFNGSLAVQTSRPHLSANVAAQIWQGIKNSPHNKEYMQELQSRLSSMVDVKAEHLTKELIQWSYVDATQYIGLSIDDLKALPPEARRAIQSFEVTEHVDKHGNPNGTTVKVKLINKLDSMKELAKHIGYYERDNDQKATKVNILNVLKSSDPDTLNKLLATIEAQQIEME